MMSRAQREALQRIADGSNLCPPITRRALKLLRYITYERKPKGKFRFSITLAGRKALADESTAQETRSTV
jgi:hypothetical protein